MKTVAPVCSIYCLRMKYSKDKNPRQHESQPRTLDWNRCISVAHSRGKQFASATFSIPLLTPTSSPTGIPRRDYLHRPWQKYNFSPPQTCHCLPKRAGREEGERGWQPTSESSHGERQREGSGWKWRQIGGLVGFIFRHARVSAVVYFSAVVRLHR